MRSAYCAKIMREHNAINCQNTQRRSANDKPPTPPPGGESWTAIRYFSCGSDANPISSRWRRTKYWLDAPPLAEACSGLPLERCFAS
jgi:hypothetical protein